MSEIFRFPIMIAASIIVLALIIQVVTLANKPRPNFALVLLVAAIVSGGGMLFAKYGANAGLPWTVYYTVPALLTVLLPPLVFRMRLGAALFYVVLAGLSAPAIHYAFSLLLGWNEYMPFLPPLGELT